MPSGEKGAKACKGDTAGHFLRSGLRAKVAELRGFSAILRAMQPGFYTVQTEWRRERDSNPRYPLRYSGFQDRLFQPLTHPSAGTRGWLSLVYNKAGRPSFWLDPAGITPTGGGLLFAVFAKGGNHGHRKLSLLTGPQVSKTACATVVERRFSAA
jgi:hypothetical protein